VVKANDGKLKTQLVITQGLKREGKVEGGGMDEWMQGPLATPT